MFGDDTLAQNISTLRRVLVDDANRPQFIATVPRRGYRLIAAVRAVAAPTAGEPLEAATSEASPSVTEAAARGGSGRALALIGIGALTAALGAFVAQRLSVEERPRALVQFTVGEPEAHRFSTSGGMLALSPNGHNLSFVAVDASGSPSLWLRPLGSTVSRRLDDTEGAAQPFWSPDSRTVAFFAERRLKAIDVTSGAVRVIASLASPRSLGGTWSRTGEILFSLPADGLCGACVGRIAAANRSGSAEQCEGCVAWPHFLPDGRRFLYTLAGSDAEPPASMSGSWAIRTERACSMPCRPARTSLRGCCLLHVQERWTCSGSTRAACA